MDVVVLRHPVFANYFRYEMIYFRRVFCDNLNADIILTNTAGNISYIFKYNQLLRNLKNLVRLYFKPNIRFNG